ncbi:protein of unknown function [Streptantibioticus cattleyicolor NRRL 8057 = DSM 46488]|nr:protein of unknown function [Streptantibioticus cattleyicolor NRRL 8057 = DSM 46488]
MPQGRVPGPSRHRVHYPDGPHPHRRPPGTPGRPRPRRSRAGQRVTAAVPDAARDVIHAALTDWWILTDPTRRDLAHAADQVTAYLTASGYQITPQPAHPQPETPMPLPLTPRQIQVIAGLARGHSTIEIAAHLEIAPGCVRSHLNRISTRLGTHSAAGTVGHCYRAGVLTGLHPEPLPGDIRLTLRQHQVLELMAHGRRNEEIAAQLHLSLDTVKTHGRHLFATVGARSRAHAVALGYQHGLLSLTDRTTEAACA